MMTQADLMLIIEPLLVVLRTSRVENPLAESLAHPTQVVAERLAVTFTEERLEQMRLGSDEAIPHVQNGFHLVLHHIVRET